MKNSERTVLLSGIILICSGSSSADDYHESGLVNQYDHNRDGLITRAEYDKGFEKKMRTKLEWLDTNKDGVITPEEFRDQHKIEFNARWSMWDADVHSRCGIRGRQVTGNYIVLDTAGGHRRRPGIVETLAHRT